jgi:hypothetical protein
VVIFVEPLLTNVQHWILFSVIHAVAREWVELYLCSPGMSSSCRQWQIQLHFTFRNLIHCAYLKSAYFVISHLWHLVSGLFSLGFPIKISAFTHFANCRDINLGISENKTETGKKKGLPLKKLAFKMHGETCKRWQFRYPEPDHIKECFDKQLSLQAWRELVRDYARRWTEMWK